MTDQQWMQEFAKKLRYKMNARGVSQKELSQLSGVSEATISRYLTGEQPPKFLSVIKIAKALNASVLELKPL